LRLEARRLKASGWRLDAGGEGREEPGRRRGPGGAQGSSREARVQGRARGPWLLGAGCWVLAAG
jgi:hypothetical protein